MKLITIRTPQGKGRAVAALAFEKQILEVAISSTEVFRPGVLEYFLLAINPLASRK